MPAAMMYRDKQHSLAVIPSCLPVFLAYPCLPADESVCLFLCILLNQQNVTQVTHGHSIPSAGRLATHVCV